MSTNVKRLKRSDIVISSDDESDEPFDVHYSPPQQQRHVIEVSDSPPRSSNVYRSTTSQPSQSSKATTQPLPSPIVDPQALVEQLSSIVDSSKIAKHMLMDIVQICDCDIHNAAVFCLEVQQEIENNSLGPKRLEVYLWQILKRVSNYETLTMQLIRDNFKAIYQKASAETKIKLDQHFSAKANSFLAMMGVKEKLIDEMDLEQRMSHIDRAQRHAFKKVVDYQNAIAKTMGYDRILKEEQILAVIAAVDNDADEALRQVGQVLSETNQLAPKAEAVEMGFVDIRMFPIHSMAPQKPAVGDILDLHIIKEHDDIASRLELHFRQSFHCVVASDFGIRLARAICDRILAAEAEIVESDHLSQTARITVKLQPESRLAGTVDDQFKLQQLEEKAKDQTEKMPTSNVFFVLEQLTPSCSCESCAERYASALAKRHSSASTTSTSHVINGSMQSFGTAHNRTPHQQNTPMDYLQGKHKLQRRKPPANQFKVPLKSYQEQALWWMMERERDLGAVPNPRFVEFHDGITQRVWVHRAFDLVWSQMPVIHATGRGGILADDMGVGKTIETLSLIVTNPRKPSIESNNSNSNNSASENSKPKRSTRLKRKRSNEKTIIEIDNDNNSNDNSNNDESDEYKDDQPNKSTDEANDSDEESIKENDDNDKKTVFDKMMSAKSNDTSTNDNKSSSTSSTKQSNDDAPTNVSQLDTTLIILPVSLMAQWEIELKRFTHLKHIVCRGSKELQKAHKSFHKFNVVMTSYSTLLSERTKSGCVYKYRWWRVVLDEAHLIRSRGTQKAKACFALEADNRWALTGTPIQNKLLDLYSLFKFLRVEPCNDFRWFNMAIVKPLASNDQFSSDEAKALLQASIHPLLLRRLKTEVLPTYNDNIESNSTTQSNNKNSDDDMKHDGDDVDNQHSMQVSTRSNSMIDCDDSETEATLTTTTTTTTTPAAASDPTTTTSNARRTVRVVRLRMSRAEHAIYAQLNVFASRRVKALMETSGGIARHMSNVLELLLRLRQCCNHPFLLCVALQKKYNKAQLNNADAATLQKLQADLISIVSCLRGRVPKSFLPRINDSAISLSSDDDDDDDNNNKGNTADPVTLNDLLEQQQQLQQLQSMHTRQTTLTVKENNNGSSSAQTSTRSIVLNTIMPTSNDDSDDDLKAALLASATQPTPPIDVDDEEEQLKLALAASLAELSSNVNTTTTSTSNNNLSNNNESKKTKLDIMSIDNIINVNDEDDNDNDDDAYTDDAYEIDEEDEEIEFTLKNSSRSRRKRKHSSTTLDESNKAMLKRTGAQALELLWRGLDQHWMSSTKLDYLIGKLKLFAENNDNEKSIVFCQFTQMLDLCEKALKKNKIQFCRFDGSMKQTSRAASLNEFRRNSKKTVLLASLTAGNLGLNLDCASRVFLMAPWYNPFVEEQAIARVDRMGQDRHVQVYRLIMKDTVEEKLLDTQERKRALVSTAGLKSHDLAALLGIDLTKSD